MTMEGTASCASSAVGRESTAGGSCNCRADLVKEQMHCDPVGPLARSGSQWICNMLVVLLLWIRPQSTLLAWMRLCFIYADMVMHYGY